MNNTFYATVKLNEELGELTKEVSKALSDLASGAAISTTLRTKIKNESADVIAAILVLAEELDLDLSGLDVRINNKTTRWDNRKKKRKSHD